MSRAGMTVNAAITNKILTFKLYAIPLFTVFEVNNGMDAVLALALWLSKMITVKIIILETFKSRQGFMPSNNCFVAIA
jgi:hypothetical protein